MRRIVSWLITLESIVLATFAIAVAGSAADGVTTLGAIITAVVAGMVPILASLMAIRNPGIGARMALWDAPIALLFVLLYSWEFGGILRAVGFVVVALVIPGLFWLFAGRHKWPPLLPSFPFSSRPLFVAALGSGLFGIVPGVAFFWSLGMPWWPLIGDCFGRPVLDERGAPSGMDFTAKILFVGPRTFQGLSLWAIARIQERFSAVDSFGPGIVILRGTFKPSDTSRQYFVEGGRGQAVFARLLPVIQPAPCGHTGPREKAAIALRILHDGRPKGGARFIGRVYLGDRWKTDSPTPLPGMGILIEGPAGSAIARSDEQGVYSQTGLPPGQYTLHLKTKSAGGGVSYGIVDTAVVDLRDGEIGGRDFYVSLAGVN